MGRSTEDDMGACMVRAAVAPCALCPVPCPRILNPGERQRHLALGGSADEASRVLSRSGYSHVVSEANSGRKLRVHV